MDVSVAIEREFQRESHRIDQLIWEGMALRAGESVLFCGFSNNVEWIKRAARVDVAVSVISDDAEAMREFRDLPVTIVRGSTSMLPARDASYDATIAFHYLHEVDPFFHANIVAELGRVGKRFVIVEPAPPSDPLGLRIASLYSRAKRELGQFENYHHLDYWRKLLTIVKSDVSCQTLTFLRSPPEQAVRDTVALIIDTMAAEQTPEVYLYELRALAARPDAQLLPQARYVIVGTATKQPALSPGATQFRELAQEDSAVVPAVQAFVPPSLSRTSTSGASPVVPAFTTYSNAESEPEFPTVLPPPQVANVGTKPASRPPASPIARNAFGLSPAAEPAPPGPVPTIRSAPDLAEDEFGVPDMPSAESPTEFGWAWEPPEEKTEA